MPKKKQGEVISDKLVLKQAVRKKTNYLLKKPKIDPSEAYNLVKDFFKAFTGKEYEFTHEELTMELDKVYIEESDKKRLTDIIDALGVIEYYSQEYNEQEVRKSLQDFADIVERVVHQEALKTTFWDKFARRFRKKKPQKKKQTEEKTALQKFVEEANDMKIDKKKEKKVEQPFEVPVEEIVETIPLEETTVETPLETMEPEEFKMPVETPAETIQEVEQTKETEPSNFSEQVPDELPETIQPAQIINVEPQEIPKAESVVVNPPVFDEGMINSRNLDEDGTAQNDFTILLDSLHEHLDNKDLEMARLEYKEILHTYERMPADEKQKNYDQLMKAYNRYEGFL